jgi:hypothetical protein
VKSILCEARERGLQNLLTAGLAAHLADFGNRFSLIKTD